MRMAGIKLWVLTGDKVDTAKNIGYACKLLSKGDMELLEYPKEIPDAFQATRQLRDKQQQLTQSKRKTALIVTGDVIEQVAQKQNPELYKAVVYSLTQFCEVALDSDVVLACRVSPKQKQEIVHLVKEAVA